MFDWQYDELRIPTQTVTFLILYLGFDWLGILFVRPFLLLLLRSQRTRNELASNILGYYSVLYGLLIGLLVVAGYQNYLDLRVDAEEEAVHIVNLYQVTQVLPLSVHAQISSYLVDYTEIVITEEWPQQQEGIVPDEQKFLVRAIQQAIFSHEPVTKREEIALEQAAEIFYQLIDARRIRLNASTLHLPGILWYVVIMGGFSSLVLLWLFDTKLIVQFVMGGFLAVFVATMLAVLAALDNPFSGDVGVIPEPFVVAQQYMTSENSSLENSSPENSSLENKSMEP